MKLRERLNTIAEITRHPSNTGRRAGAVLKYLRWNFGHRALGTDYIMPLVGTARLILSDRQNYATLVYTCQLWGFAEQAFLLHFLRPDDLFVDVGANVGGYTVLASAVAGARSMAFEPVPSTFAELQRNVRLNDIGHLVQAYCCALGETAGKSRMTAHRGGLNHMVFDADALQPVAETVEVATDRLDSMLDGAPCQAIKMDAEGFELSILRGAPDTLSRASLQAIVVELNSSGTRYGVTDDHVHQSIIQFGFEPCSYNARTRELAVLPSYNRRGLSTLYIRDRQAVIKRLAGGRPFALGDQSF